MRSGVTPGPGPAVIRGCVTFGAKTVMSTIGNAMCCGAIMSTVGTHGKQGVGVRSQTHTAARTHTQIHKHAKTCTHTHTHTHLPLEQPSTPSTYTTPLTHPTHPTSPHYSTKDPPPPHFIKTKHPGHKQKLTQNYNQKQQQREKQKDDTPTHAKYGNMYACIHPRTCQQRRFWWCHVVWGHCHLRV